ncbi:MAG: tetratricopeptide repeat protein [Nitrospirae bacterium]|nr:tetratricopeptide repeat protein [Nitrospirota bacterium]
MQVSEKQSLATALNLKAQADFRKGNYSKAASLYAEALRINRSLDNADGVATELINLSQAYRKMSEPEKAHKALDELLGVNSKLYNEQYAIEAAFVKSLLSLDSKDHEKTTQWSDNALARCKDRKCNAAGKIINLKARIALIRSDYANASSYASDALNINRSQSNAEESANSLRILAECRLAAGAYAEARKLFEEALASDKAAGLSAKIKTDLTGIGKTHCAQKNTEAGIEFLKRALTVSDSSGDASGADEIKQLITQCSTASGKN